ncbi:MAG TPA: nitroreductase, partial [Mesorhizobium sp.]|nr:nitroreductase [Mesorhizobium sp.]
GRAILGLAPHERVVGFVHIGTHEGAVPERPRPDPATLYADYAGPWKE